MDGMTIGMTQGMMTGITVGYFIGATSNMFISNIVGVVIGLIFGIVFGLVGGLMGIMNGGMGGMMGGMMGAMLGVMLQYLYNGQAVIITSVFMFIIYLAAMIALIRLVQQGAIRVWKVDLVCGMNVDPQKCIRHGYQNQTYYFCSTSCRETFAHDPGPFIMRGSIEANQSVP
jgi:YHS domain-containing protein